MGEKRGEEGRKREEGWEGENFTFFSIHKVFLVILEIPTETVPNTLQIRSQELGAGRGMGCLAQSRPGLTGMAAAT